MLKYKKPANRPVVKQAVPVETAASRLERVRLAAAERHKRADTDGARRRDRQTAEANRLI